MKKIMYLLIVIAFSLILAGDNNVQWDGTFHGSAANSASSTIVFAETYNFLDNTNGGDIYDDETIYFASSAYKDDITAMKVRVWNGSIAVWADGSFQKNQNWYNWMGSGYTADYGIWRASIAAGTGGIDAIGTIYYRIQHIDGTDDDYLVSSGGDYQNPYGQFVDDDGLATDYSFSIIDDDEVSPTFSNPTFIEANKKFQIDITDASGIYDDATGSAGQGIYMIYDDDGEVNTNNDGEVQLSLSAGDTYITDSALPYDIGTTVSYKIFAYDNDADRTNDKTLGTYESSGVLPIELTSFTALTKNKTVELKWSTATEVNNYGFYVERTSVRSEELTETGPASSENDYEGTGPASSQTDYAGTGWETLGFVEGYGNSNAQKDYSFVDADAGYGTFYYRLKQVDLDGAFEYSDVVEVKGGEIPNGFVLEQNYPNPFNPKTTIKFAFAEDTRAQLKVFNPVGEQVAELYNNVAKANEVYNVEFNGSQMASGIYFYRLITPDNAEVRKMLLIK